MRRCVFDPRRRPANRETPPVWEVAAGAAHGRVGLVVEAVQDAAAARAEEKVEGREANGQTHEPFTFLLRPTSWRGLQRPNRKRDKSNSASAMASAPK